MKQLKQPIFYILSIIIIGFISYKFLQASLITWIFFTLFLSLLPLVLNRVLNKNNSWDDFWSDGQILLIGIIIGTEGFAQIFSIGIDGNSYRSFVAGGCFVSIISSCIMYPSCFDKSQHQKLKWSPETISIILFGLCLVTSIACKITVEITTIQ